MRKAILGSLAISDHTILRRRAHADAADDVRRVAFLLTSKVPVDAISIALRATAIRRGLAEQFAVSSGGIDMLWRWHLAFEGDVLALLAALDAESNERVAEDVVKELIACGKIKPAGGAVRGERQPPGGGLRRASHPRSPSGSFRPSCRVLARGVRAPRRRAPERRHRHRRRSEPGGFRGGGW